MPRIKKVARTNIYSLKQRAPSDEVFSSLLRGLYRRQIAGWIRIALNDLPVRSCPVLHSEHLLLDWVEN
jgi:hypothetical protein